MKSFHKSLIFFILLLSMSLYYNYNEIVFKRPQSTHKWRQTDCASLALNYYQNGMKFFNPETHNLTSDGGKSGKAATSEVPILYFFVAILYKIFGYHEYIYRLLNTLIFFLGLFYLFKIFRLFLIDTFWSIGFTLIIFTSPVLIFYGNNFLTNSSALALSIIGWYYFFRFYLETEFKWYLYSVIFFFLAACFKISSLISLFGICIAYIVGGKSEIKKVLGVLSWYRIVMPVILLLAIVGSWILYAIHYNRIHECFYFSTTIFPIWQLDKSEVVAVLKNITDLWIDQYFHYSVIVFLTILAILIICYYRNIHQVIVNAVLIITIEVIAYVALQFWTLADHDYYTIDLFILPILVLIGSSIILKKKFPKLFNSIITKTVFFLFFVFNVYYAHGKISDRYNGWWNDYPKFKDIYTVTPYLRQIGITPSDTVISIPDNSNSSLYLMNQKGWTEYTDARLRRGEPIKYNHDSAGIANSIRNGGRYLIINGIVELYKKEYLQSYCKYLLGQYNNILIFDVKRDSTNFSLEKRVVEKIYFCDAEKVDSSGRNFVDLSDTSFFFENGVTRSKDYAKGGGFSCKVDINHPFGMTLKLGNVKAGESFDLDVWRKSTNKQLGALIASISSENQYYNNNSKILEVSSDEWEHLSMQFFINEEYSGKELVIYVYNPEKAPVYFDNFKIARYKSVMDAYRK